MYTICGNLCFLIQNSLRKYHTRFWFHDKLNAVTKKINTCRVFVSTWKWEFNILRKKCVLFYGETYKMLLWNDTYTGLFVTRTLPPILTVRRLNILCLTECRRMQYFALYSVLLWSNYCIWHCKILIVQMWFKYRK